MASRPPSQSTALFWVFKIIAGTLLVINVIWHGLVAMFIAGPVGLGGYLLAVVTFWMWASATMRRLQASAAKPPVPIQPDEAEAHDPDPVASGVG
ncbi:MAG: hypothetical protein V4850_21155 [Myxococcota bacterium]